MRKEYLVKDPLGLHARPATLIVQELGKHENNINLIYNDKEVNGKSIMGVMSLAISVGTSFSIDIEGDNADSIFENIEAILTKHSII